MTEQPENKAKTGIELLREAFPEHQISKLPKPTKSQTDAVRNDIKNGARCDLCGGWHHPGVKHVDYVGHAALTDRLLDCDTRWNWEPVSTTEDGTPKFDSVGGMWIRLTVCDVTRLGYGHAEGKSGGDAIKEVIGDALRNAAMRFGAALDQWHRKGDLHMGEDDDGNNAAANPPKIDNSKANESIAGEREESLKPDADPFEDKSPPTADAIEHVIATMKTMWDLGELIGYWHALAEMQPGMQSAPGVANAKDTQKLAIEAKRDEDATAAADAT